jgi:hypothetical protein
MSYRQILLFSDCKITGINANKQAYCYFIHIVNKITINL